MMKSDRTEYNCPDDQLILSVNNFRLAHAPKHMFQTVRTDFSMGHLQNITDHDFFVYQNLPSR